jgi:hypothetical protein
LTEQASVENIVKPVAQENSADKIPASPIKTDETATVKKEEQMAEISKVIDSASGNKESVQREMPEQKKLLEAPEPEVSSEKADGISLRREIEDNNKEVLPELPPKTEKVFEATAKAKKPEAPGVSAGTSEPLVVSKKDDIAKNVRQKRKARKKMRENSGAKIPDAKREKLILPDIGDIIKGAPLEPNAKTEVPPGMNGEAKTSESPQVNGRTAGHLMGPKRRVRLEMRRRRKKRRKGGKTSQMQRPESLPLVCLWTNHFLQGHKN